MIVKEDFSKWAEIVRSEQLSVDDLVKLFEDNPQFSLWYFTTYKTPRR